VTNLNLRIQVIDLILLQIHMDYGLATIFISNGHEKE